MSRLQLATLQIVAARNYTLGLLEDVKPEDWFRLPAGGVTHIAWQVGHLAFGEYALALKRTRGARADDEELMPETFVRLFGKGSEPSDDASKYPNIDAVRAVLDRVHEQTLAEIATFSEDELDDAAPPPAHPAFTTKLEALLYCARHEALHAGQIGLLRRLLGYKSLR
jgi:hypothetical protein